MRAPQLEVVTANGERTPLSGLYTQRPLCLILLRHLGCIFCRRQVSLLRTRRDLNIAFGCMAEPAEALAFARRLRSPHTFLCDPAREIYSAFGLGLARPSQLVGPRVVLQGVTAIRYGIGRTVGDPRQLAGSFVIDRSGEVVWSRRAIDASESVSAETIERELGLADAKA